MGQIISVIMAAYKTVGMVKDLVDQLVVAWKQYQLSIIDHNAETKIKKLEYITALAQRTANDLKLATTPEAKEKAIEELKIVHSLRVDFIDSN